MPLNCSRTMNKDKAVRRDLDCGCHCGFRWQNRTPRSVWPLVTVTSQYCSPQTSTSTSTWLQATVNTMHIILDFSGNSVHRHQHRSWLHQDIKQDTAPCHQGQHKIWTSSWPQVAEQATHISLVLTAVLSPVPLLSTAHVSHCVSVFLLYPSHLFIIVVPAAFAPRMGSLAGVHALHSKSGRSIFLTTYIDVRHNFHPSEYETVYSRTNYV